MGAISVESARRKAGSVPLAVTIPRKAPGRDFRRAGRLATLPPASRQAVAQAAETQLADDSLLAGLRLGAEGAPEILFERFHGKVFNLAMSILRNQGDAEEITQDVFMTVIRKANTFKGNSALYSWIYRICVNACLMRLRRRKRDGTVSIEEFLPVFTDEGLHASPVDDWSKEVERRILDKELGRVIRKYTDNLSDKYRVVFILSDIEGLTNEETAEALGLSVPAVKSRLHRARLYLRERIGRYLKHGKA